jgi:hypothetical protein
MLAPEVGFVMTQTVRGFGHFVTWPFAGSATWPFAGVAWEGVSTDSRGFAQIGKEYPTFSPALLWTRTGGLRNGPMARPGKRRRVGAYGYNSRLVI